MGCLFGIKFRNTAIVVAYERRDGDARAALPQALRRPS